MLQYCCGSGDCDQAVPPRSHEEFNQFKTLSGLGSASGAMSMPILFKDLNMTNGPSMKSKDILKLSLKLDKGTVQADSRTHPREILGVKNTQSCGYQEQRRYTTLGQAYRASDTVECAAGGCSIQVSTTITEGRSVDVSVGFDIFEVIHASTDITFTEEKSYQVATTETGAAGESGYMVYNPYLMCTAGQLTNCDQDLSVVACTPMLTQAGQPEGEYAFVQTS